MKNKISVMLVALVLISGAARAQWPVTDLAGLTQSIINSSNEMVQTSSTAQTMVQNFQETQKIYDQSKKYYDTLKKVKNLVRSPGRSSSVFFLWEKFRICMSRTISSCFPTRTFP